MRSRRAEEQPDAGVNPALDAERSVLAAMLLDHESIQRARELLDARDFGRTAYQKIFEALLELHDRGERADLVTVAEELRRRGDFDTIGGPPVLAQLMELATTSANVEAHARIVREHAENRSARRLLLEILQEVEREPDRAAEILRTRKVGANGTLAGGDRASRGVNVTRLSEVEARAVRWFWRHRIPRGGVTISSGQGGVGKSTIALDLVARATTGRPMPDGDPGPGEPVSVVLFTAEDPLDSVVVPRLRLAGADLSRVVTLTVSTGDGEVRPLMVTPADLSRLEAIVRNERAALVVWDPIVAFVDATANMHHAQDARRVLAMLHRMAERYDLAVLAIHHHNKSQTLDPTMRLSGSAAIGQAARSVLVVGTDPDDHNGERMILALDKRNLAPRDLPSLAFLLVVEPGAEHPRVEWQGASAVTARDLVAVPADPEERGAVNEAVDFLRSLLAEGPVLAREGETEARGRGIAERTLKRARRHIGVLAEREEVTNRGRVGAWWWRLSHHVTPWPPGTLAKDANDLRLAPRCQSATVPGGQAVDKGESIERQSKHLAVEQCTLLAREGWDPAGGDGVWPEPSSSSGSGSTGGGHA